ncbi:extracellular catalytic domain type 1 short-chain-length polyhydroxyalkanoate depolymerase [Antarcticirhabdus aurantiaca]|uniref:PHB depolymerase family esterase n=1 Tax=Antarcticirhabdus aurantiaca TaxID=2606717 RepID=A0ACD4NMB2_9HYPH|nr:PHB depolymerase family esterase [Antarcticirhabdus aurantiaca]WAJ27969.1 PHB depolymerase family esterase [Jeongeuplla avenae]
MDLPLPFIAEAQRLVLSQRLSQATALIQERLGARPASNASAAGFDGLTIELSAEPAAGTRPAPPPPGAGLCSRPRFAFAQGATTPPRPAAAEVDIPQGAEFLRLQHDGPFGRRSFRLYVPAAADEGPRPLVVMLHGCTQNPEDFAAGTRMNALAEEFGLLVAYPEQPRSANPSLCWNWFDPAHQRGGAGEPAILAGIVADIARSHPVDRDRIFAAGLSAGGAMAAVLGSTRADLFAAVGIHSGLPRGSADSVAAALSVMRSGRSQRDAGAPEVPAIIFHGTRDTTVHPANGEQLAGLGTAGRQANERVIQGSANGRAFVRSVRPADGTAPARELWRVEGLGHAWSGGDSHGSYADPAGPDASREMLRFFLEHPRR